MLKLNIITLVCSLGFLMLPYAVNAQPTPFVNYQKSITTENQVVHQLLFDPKQVKIISVNASKYKKTRATVTYLARKEKAIAAINGGFFKMGLEEDGVPAGILQIDNHWHGIAYRSRGAIGWSNDPYKVLVDRVQTKTGVFIHGEKYPVHAMNKAITPNRAILYSPSYGKKIYAKQDDIHFVIEHNTITEISGEGRVQIPANGYVYSVGSILKEKILSKEITLGDPAAVQVQVLPQFKQAEQMAWQQFSNITGGAPVMIYQGKLVTDFDKEKIVKHFIEAPYARTAIGLTPKGLWMWVVVEANPKRNRPGMSIHELAQWMQQQGCNYALNLDGGGSSTMYYNGNTVNQSYGDEDEGFGRNYLRKVSDALMVLPKT